MSAYPLTDDPSAVEFDPFTIEIIQNSLQAICDEMFVAMRKTAMSSIIYEVLDMGTAVVDPHGNLASAGAGIPLFVAGLDNPCGQCVARFVICGCSCVGNCQNRDPNGPERGGVAIGCHGNPGVGIRASARRRHRRARVKPGPAGFDKSRDWS